MNKKLDKYWIKKFFYAFRGIVVTIKEEKSMIFHFVSMIVAIILSAALKIKLESWPLIIISIALIICVEFINTAIENLVDMVSFKFNFNARKVKDISAAATLIITISAILVSLLVYVPRIKEIIEVGY